MTDGNPRAAPKVESAEIKKLTKEEKREAFLYKILVPIVGAILAAMVGTVVLIWFRSANMDNAQLKDVMVLIKDPQLNASQKLQALSIYKEITDRPWSILRSLLMFLGFSISSVIGALTVGGFFNRRP